MSADILLQEAAKGVIEHTAFDTLTLERMLQYIYMGDYTVNAPTPQAMVDYKSCPQSVDSGHGAADDVSKYVHPHGRQPAAQDPLDESQSTALVPIAEPEALVMIPAIAHVLVYAIAVYYELSDLKGIAMTKFQDPDMAVHAGYFVDVARAVYTHTTSDDDELRQEVLAMALTRVDELMANESFVTALLNAPELQDFVVHFLPAAIRQARDQGDEATSLKSVVGMQQQDISNTQKALQTAKAKVAQATERADKHLAELITLRKAVEDEKAISDRLDYQLNRKLVDLDNAKANTTKAAERADQLKAELAMVRQQREDDKSKQARTAQNTEEFWRKAYENQRRDLQNTVQSDVHANDELQQLKAEAAKPKKHAPKHPLNAAMKLAIEHPECRNCRNDFNSLGWQFEWDDRTNEFASIMLRCLNCRCRHPAFPTRN